MADDVSGRHRPALPPDGEDPPAQQPSPYRRIPVLFTDTFELVGRRWRELFVIAIVAAAAAVVALVLFLSGGNILFDELIETDEFEAFAAAVGENGPLSDTSQTGAGSDSLVVAWNALLDSIDADRVRSGVLLIGLGVLVSILGLAPIIAASRVALADVDGNELTANSALADGFKQVPKVLVLALGYLAVLAATVLVIVLLFMVHGALGVLGLLMAVGVLGVFGLLVQMHFVCAYVEPGYPRVGRWWLLIKRRKAATWGRVALIAVISFGISWSSSLIASPLPSPYGDFVANVIVAPIVGILTATAHVLMYADLSGRGRPSPLQ